MRMLLWSMVMSALLMPQVVASQQLRPSDFLYLGAFKLPNASPNGLAINTYGQKGLSFDENGDPTNTDPFPGSLWMTGHDYNRDVFELAIPTPVTSTNYGSLPTATLITNPIDFTAGSACTTGSEWFSGVEVHQGRVWGSCANFYNVGSGDLPDVLWNRNLNLGDLDGPFHAGPIGQAEFHSNRQGAYVISIPQGFAEEFFGGRSLATGFSRNSHGGQQGPTFLAFDPSNPSNAYDVIWYRQWDVATEPRNCFTNKSDCDFPEYTACDEWWSGAWAHSGSRQALLISGKKFDGPSVYEPGGWVCDPGFGEIIFYDPLDLAARSAGLLEPWEVVPYLTWRPTELWGAGHAIGGLAFDPTNGILYFVEKFADGTGNSIVHVYQTGDWIFADGFESGSTQRWNRR